MTTKPLSSQIRYNRETLEQVVTDLESSGGSDRIGFVQSGGVARTVQDKLRDNVSAKDFGVVGDGNVDDTTAIQDAITFTSENPNRLLDLRADNYHVYTATGGTSPNTSHRLIQQGDISAGITDTINTDLPSSFIGGDGEGGVLPLGVYRKYTYTPGDQKIQNGFVYSYNITADIGSTSTSAAGLQVKTKLNVNEVGSGSFAWHNFQSYIECNAYQDHEPCAGYFGTYATEGATPWGMVIASHSTSTGLAPNHVYGLQLEVGSSVPCGVSGKALSIWNAGIVKLTYGSVSFGENGFNYGNLVTNKSDRSESESPHLGTIDRAFCAEGSDRLYAFFIAQGTIPLAIGNVVVGGSSGGQGTVTHVKVDSGSWSGGDATGRVWIDKNEATPTFIPGDSLLVGGVGRVSISGLGFMPVGEITVGFEASNTSDYAFVATDAAHNPLWGVTGSGVLFHTIQNVTNPAATSFSAASGNIFSLPEGTVVAGTEITDITGGIAGQEITIFGVGGTYPIKIKHGGGSGSSNIALASGDWTASLGKILRLLWNGMWWEISRT